ncbi:cytochrome C oxidase subunit I [Bosea thiooxidans]|uniref:Cytochrome C oxidase subunit I n=1 Tax=Bosea thiooxidans TaxID=53254 RepID=A0A0Q3KJH5_9HYPH|nr:DUF2189 domain-containing protein [Bosea thiooxidans]KQK29723.1 cytochrome C oxidase subunit I [Bosea thiooxidans]SKB35023.1 Uncharacterized membrane protein [Bosea thiooxidans]
MANLDGTVHDIATLSQPRIRTITPMDLRDALWRGWKDFEAQPSHLVFIALIYPIAGIVLAQLTVSYNIFPLLFPLLSGFALLGPFAAIGLYEVSRRREKGLDSSWTHALGVLQSRSIGQIALLGAMLTGLFLAWLLSAWVIYRGLLGLPADVSTGDFLRAVFTTFDGWVMIVVGNSIGLLFAILAFSISVVSFPLIIDRHVDAPTAIRTSIAAVEANPRVMMYWGLIVTGLLVLGCALVLVGLVVVMPVLGHATWHLYRKVVA